MAKYKVTTDQGSYMVETEDASSPASAPNYPIVKSAAAGATQGALMGWADEGAGLIAGTGRDLMAGKLPTVDSYARARDVFREKYDRAEQANPKSYMAGEIGGAMATSFAPGMQGVTLPKLAVLGGIQGLGNSKADLTKGEFTSTAVNTGIGALSGSILGKITPPVLKKGVEGAKYLGKKVFGSVLGPSEEAITAYLKNPAAIKKASMEGLAEEMPEVANKFKKIIGKGSAKAKELLSTSRYLKAGPTDKGGALTKDEIFDIVKSARRKLGGVYTDESKVAAGAIGRISENLKKIKNTVSQKQLSDLIDDLDEEINWKKVIESPELMTATDKALVNLRTGFDGALKKVNKAYGKAMKPVEEAIESRNEFTRKFSIKRIKGGEYVPTDTTYSRTNTALREGKLETDRVMENVKKITGVDIGPKVKNAKYAQEFTGGKTNGSRNVNTGAVLGTGIGGALGGAVGFPVPGAMMGAGLGATAGSYIDRKGGEVAADLLDKYIGSKQVMGSVGNKIATAIPTILKVNPKALGRFAPQLAQAAKLGAQQVALQHWLLMDSDPEYQQIVDGLEGGNWDRKQKDKNSPVDYIPK